MKEIRNNKPKAKYMKRNFILGFLVILIAVASCSFTNNAFETDDKDKLLLDLITYVLERGHYEPKDINDDFSVNVFEDFLETIDPTKRYFLERDIMEFEQYKFQIDDQIKNTDISFFNLVYDRLMMRMEEAKGIYAEVMDTPFDFGYDESININYENLGYVSSKKELKERWRKQMKLNTIATFGNKVTDENKKAETEKGYKPLSMEEIEESARLTTREELDDYFDLLDNEMQRKDWFVIYLNSIAHEFDPHTLYFAPEEKDKFDIGMSGKFEGIGARLQKKPEGAKIVEIISGGPVWRDQKLEVGDQILKVGQEGETPVDIVGMRLDDAVKLIKGPKGTTVNLTVRKVDGTIEEISITRDVVEVEEGYAKSATVTQGKYKFGIIDLPKFYADFNNYADKNAATDVAKEVKRLKQEGVQGLVLDLRDNGGGSLQTVVEMAGLFIKDGPIVQVKSSGSDKAVYEDKDERIQWDGPLVILVNELSASASEILAAAMQDYKRAVVIGSKQTFGKGTVQRFIPLENIVHSNEYGDLGALKITTQKFYRVNGESNQLKGVESDVIVPDRYSYIDLGEKDQDNPLQWDKITPAKYQPWEGYIDYEATIANSNRRMNQHPQIKLIEENALWLKQQQEQTVISLNYNKYKVEEEKNKERSNYFKTLSEYDSRLTFESLKYEKELFTQDPILREKRDRWHQDLAKDVYVEEAVNVLQDLRINNIKNGKLASVKG